MGTYIGPERRKGERRHWDGGLRPSETDQTAQEQRSGVERRQEALTGVIAGLSAEDMQRLAKVWGDIEAEREHMRTRDECLDVADKYTDC